MELNYLFVYGTLLKNFDSHMSKFLEKNAEFVSEGFFYGRLYEVSWYPGAVISTNETEKVYGHIFKIKNEAKTFKILDDYEGIVETAEHPNEYTRILIDTFLRNNTTIKSWVYGYNFKTTNLKRILSGNYLKQ